MQINKVPLSGEMRTKAKAKEGKLRDVSQSFCALFPWLAQLQRRTSSKSTVNMVETLKTLAPVPVQSQERTGVPLMAVSQEEFPLSLGRVSLSGLCVLPLTERGSFTRKRAICCTQSTGSNSNLIQKCPPRPGTDTPRVMVNQMLGTLELTIPGENTQGQQAIHYGWHKSSDTRKEEMLLIQSVFSADTSRDVGLRSSCAPREKPSEESVFAKYFPYHPHCISTFFCS